MGNADHIRDKRRSTSKPKQAASNDTNEHWKGFVACELTDAQKTAAKLLRNDPEKLNDSVFGMIDDLYKLSFSYDTYNDAYIVSATCKDKQSPNNGMTLTGRGGSIVGAMAALWYKHDIILERNWGDASRPTQRTRDADDLG